MNIFKKFTQLEEAQYYFFDLLISKKNWYTKIGASLLMMDGATLTHLRKKVCFCSTDLRIVSAAALEDLGLEIKAYDVISPSDPEKIILDEIFKGSKKLIDAYRSMFCVGPEYVESFVALYIQDKKGAKELLK